MWPSFTIDWGILTCKMSKEQQSSFKCICRVNTTMVYFNIKHCQKQIADFFDIVCTRFFLEVLEDTFIANFSMYTKSDGIGKSILSKLEQVSAPFHCCEKFPKVFMQKLFLRMRIYYALKFANQEFKQTKKKNRKYIKVTHL